MTSIRAAIRSHLTVGKLLGLSRGMIRGHAGARIGAGSKLTGPGEYRLQPGSTIGEGVRLYVGPDATFEIGRGSSIGDRSVVNVRRSVTIGERSMVSWQCQILDTDFHEILDADGVPMGSVAPIRIGDHVLVGTGAIVLKGVVIGDGAVVGAGSVVTSDVPEHTLVAGNPAKRLAAISGWT